MTPTAGRRAAGHPGVHGPRAVRRGHGGRAHGRVRGGRAGLPAPHRGGCPSPARTAAEVLLAHLQQAPRPPHEVHPEVPPALSRVVLKALAKRPEERYASAVRGMPVGSSPRETGPMARKSARCRRASLSHSRSSLAETNGRRSLRGSSLRALGPAARGRRPRRRGPLRRRSSRCRALRCWRG